MDIMQYSSQDRQLQKQDQDWRVQEQDCMVVWNKMHMV